MPRTLGDVLLQWEKLRKAGKTVSLDELCKDCPELRKEVKAKVTALKKMEQMLHLSRETKAGKETQSPLLSDLLKPGLRPIQDYQLVSRLGAGGFGEVWKAVGPGGFPVALKFLSLSDSLGIKEARSLELIKVIRHPNLLSMFGSWQVRGFLVIAMELADRTLLDRLREVTRQDLAGIPRDELLTYMQEAAKGIDYLNQTDHRIGESTTGGIQHRDIKPQNILLMGGSVKIADFGLARVLKKTVTTHTGCFTPSYAPPEFLMGHTASTSDQYSLAITYCMLRGAKLPFDGPPWKVMQGHLQDKPDLTMLPPEERMPVTRALDKNPKKRWPTCGDFISTVKSCATLTKSASARPSVARKHTDGPIGNHLSGWRRSIASLGALVIVIGCCASWYIIHEKNGDVSSEPEDAGKQQVKQSGDPEDAGKRRDDKIEDRLRLGDEAFKRKEYDLAFKWYSRAVKAEPTLATPYYYRAAPAIQRGNFKVAIEDCMNAMKLAPPGDKEFLGHVWHRLGDAYSKQGRNNFNETKKRELGMQAIDAYNAALEVLPDRAKGLAYLARGSAYTILLRDHEKGAADRQKAKNLGYPPAKRVSLRTR